MWAGEGVEFEEDEGSGGEVAPLWGRRWISWSFSQGKVSAEAGKRSVGLQSGPIGDIQSLRG